MKNNPADRMSRILCALIFHKIIIMCLLLSLEKRKFEELKDRMKATEDEPTASSNVTLSPKESELGTQIQFQEYHVY